MSDKKQSLAMNRGKITAEGPKGKGFIIVVLETLVL